jgi:probable F420-dependent oxidoreductase
MLVTDGRLAYGMQLPIQSHSTIYVADWELEAGPEELVRVARAADNAGFLYVGVCDHVAVPADLAPTMGTFWTDPVATLGLLAGVTTSVRLLSHVYVPAYRHPLVAAKSFATLDWLSGGRVIVGVGAGHAEGEFDALGVPFAERGRMLDDAIDVICAALTDEYPEVDTPTWTVDGTVGLQPRPRQSPRPPIWVGGSSRAALRRAAARGDGWLPQGTRRRDLPDAIAYLRDERERAGRGDDPLDVGANALVARDASADETAAFLIGLRDLGATNVQLAFPARDCDELVDKIAAFAADVAPLL